MDPARAHAHTCRGHSAPSVAARFPPLLVGGRIDCRHSPELERHRERLASDIWKLLS